MRNLLCIFIVLLCTITFTGQSADTPQKPDAFDELLENWAKAQLAPEEQKPKFKVEVLVTCKDENTKAFIESHIKRELRSLQDVEILDIAPTYILSIVAIEFEYGTSGRKTGDIALGSQFLRYYSPFVEVSELARASPVGSTERFTLANASFELPLFAYDKAEHRLDVGNKTRLDELCKSIVVKFDTKMLEPDRKN